MAEGLRAEALAVVVSGRLDLPADLPLLNEPDQPVLIATVRSTRWPDAHARRRVRARRRRPPAPDGRARSERGVRSVLCEGGPTLNSFLFAAGLVDELFLTMNPKVVGGAAALTIVAGRELVEPAELDLVSVAEAESELYTRWRVRESAETLHLVAGQRPCPLVIRVHGNRQDRACRVAAAAAAGHSRSSRSRT